MSSDANDIIDTTCSVCGDEVRGEKVESSTGHDDHIDKHPVEPSNAVEWKRNPVEDGVARFDCSHCDCQQTLSIEGFKDSPENGVDGFTDKRDFVREAGLANGIALLVGLVAFVLVYRAVFGPELVVSVGVIIPALVAVVSHTVARFVFGIIPFIRGSKMPIYGYTCSKCKEEIVFASDGSQLALQIQKENTQARAIS